MPTPAQGYRTKDGSRVPGTTTVLGRWKESGGLLQWAFKVGQSGARSLYEERDKAGDIGTLAHAMSNNLLLGLDPETALLNAPEEYKAKARTAFGTFCGWRDSIKAEIIAAEFPMVSEVHRFGGTPDFVMRLPDGRLALGDLKTSNGIYRDMLMQVAAYAILWNETQPEKITAGFHIARFAKEFPDFEHRYFEDLTEAGELFLLLRKAYDLDVQLKRRAA